MCSSGTYFPYLDTCISPFTLTLNQRFYCAVWDAKKKILCFMTVPHIDLINNKTPKPVREFRAEIIKMLIVSGNWPSNLNKTHPAFCVMWCFISDATGKMLHAGHYEMNSFFGSLFVSPILTSGRECFMLKLRWHLESSVISAILPNFMEFLMISSGGKNRFRSWRKSIEMQNSILDTNLIFICLYSEIPIWQCSL